MKTVLVHKNCVGMVLDDVIVDDAVGIEGTLRDLLRYDWILDVGDMISIETKWVED